jgi:hypothetical protein
MHRLHPWLIRFIGVSVLSFVTLFVFFNWVGKYNIAWALPWTKPFRLAWPDLPRFAEWHSTAPDGQPETDYQVPTRQLTQAEIRQMSYTPGATNAVTSPPAVSPAAR